MREEQARRLELVRAVELEDREATLLTREDRAQADGRARSAAAGLKGKKARQAFLAERAEFAAGRLTARHPGLAGLLGTSHWPRWVGIVVPLAALVLGFLANEFGTDKRLDLLAVPLLGTILWNLAVYLWLPISGLAVRKAAADPLTGLLARLGRGGSRDSDAHSDAGSAIDRAAGTFRQRWAKASLPLAAARASRTLHLGAALFALGLIGGIYLRAVVVEYRAGWESTFLGPEMVHAILATVLGPASALTGVAIPGVDGIAAMRWTGVAAGPEAEGVNAGPWIHLYTVTVLALVVAPRLLLAIWQGLKAWRLTRSFPVPGREDFYIRRLLRASGASAGRARVTPYAYRPGEETRRRLTGALRAVLGDGAEIRFDAPVDYGGEDRWAESYAPDPDDDYHILLYTLSATPEAENHGAIAARIVAAAGERGKGTIAGALIDESPFRAHFAGQAGLEERIAQRIEAWRSTLAPVGILPMGVDLSRDVHDGLAERIEANLVPDVAVRQ